MDNPEKEKRQKRHQKGQLNGHDSTATIGEPPPHHPNLRKKTRSTKRRRPNVAPAQNSGSSMITSDHNGGAPHPRSTFVFKRFCHLHRPRQTSFFSRCSPSRRADSPRRRRSDGSPAASSTCFRGFGLGGEGSACGSACQTEPKGTSAKRRSIAQSSRTSENRGACGGRARSQRRG